MDKKHINRRVYGYINKNNSRKEIGANKTKSDKKGFFNFTNPKNNDLVDILLKIGIFPFRLIYWILRFLWKLWQKRPKMKAKTKKEFRKKLGFVMLMILVFGFLASTITVAWISKDLPDPDRLTDRIVNQSTKIFDRTGEHVLYEVYAEQKRTLVNLEDIPQNLINGVIATEDSKFYEHKGIRISSFVRAIFYGVFTNKQIGGTSTLTQQLVKNAILNNERTFLRKLKEVIISIRLEQKYSKEQILKIYFNEIPYGSTNYGVQSAAQSYFGKNVSDLNLQECATLAGLPKAPTSYLNNSEALKQRRNFVLRRMFEEGYISEEEKNNAQAEPLTLEKKFGEMKAPHFVLYVKQKLVDMFGEQMVDTGGLKVITTLDWQKQQYAEEAIKNIAEKSFETANANNASLVAINPKTGQVLAMVGSKDFYDNEIDGQFNVATLGQRQPGSSFKPIIYAAAFEKGYTPETILWDVNTNFAVSGKPYQPKNYDLKERGPTTMRQALQGSLNISAVKTLYLVGEEKGIEFAKRLGYTTFGRGNFGLSLVLGGGEVKLIEHTAAFGVFANNGQKNPTESILKVEDPNGEILYQWKNKKAEKVLDEKITAIISNVLSDDASRAYVFGSGGVLTLPDRPVAAKTGTTNFYVDAWTVGYTPSLVAGVWVGRTDNKSMRDGDGGSKLAAPIWNYFMKKSLEGTSVEQFPELTKDEVSKPILNGSTSGLITVKINKLTGRIATSSTPSEYIIEKNYLPAHSILHYVDKDDPRGEIPNNPADDPQYSIWEAAIQDWISRKKIADPNWNVDFGEPPTEYDNEDSLQLVPQLEILQPTEGQLLTSRQLNIRINTSAPRGVTKVTYRLDNRYIGVVRNAPFNLNYYARDFANGEHTLLVIVEDDIGNKIEKQIKFSFDAEEEKPAITWLENKMILNQKDFPKVLFLNHFRLEEIQEVKIYKVNHEKELLSTINNFTNLFNNQITFNWNNTPNQGNYQLRAEIKLKNGEVYESSSMSVEVK